MIKYIKYIYIYLQFIERYNNYKCMYALMYVPNIKAHKYSKVNINKTDKTERNSNTIIAELLQYPNLNNG